MTVELRFSEAVPSWTKLGSAELFRLLENPMGKESKISEKANELDIKWHISPFYIASRDEKTMNDFLTYVANWYTWNRLIMTSNYDLLLKQKGDQFEVLPTPRPATLRHVPSNSSNIKPSGIKEIKIESLPDAISEVVAYIKKNGTDGIQPERIKNAKIYKDERYIEFSVIASSGKKGTCFSCSKEDYLMPTKETQSPLTVGLANYANFYSYHTGNIGFCRACAISNHLAFGRVLYNVSGDDIFMAIPESSSISDLIKYIKIIERSYLETKFKREIKELDGFDNILLSNSNGYFSNFVEKNHGSSGFFFLILVLFTALLNSINSLVRDIQDDKIRKEMPPNELFNFLVKGSTINKEDLDTVYSTAFKSWSFILTRNDQNVRHWRYPNSMHITRMITNIKSECGIASPLKIIQELIYKSGDNYIYTRREDFSRSMLMGKPDLGILEESVWEIMASKGKVRRGISDLALCIAKQNMGGKNMKNDEIFKQCSLIGRTIAELAAGDNNKSILYELRSVGNPQAFRGFIERFTFKCASIGKPSAITNEFVEKLMDGEEWKAYKSIIAIVANQSYSYRISEKEAPKQ